MDFSFAAFEARPGHLGPSLNNGVVFSRPTWTIDDAHAYLREHVAFVRGLRVFVQKCGKAAPAKYQVMSRTQAHALLEAFTFPGACDPKGANRLIKGTSYLDNNNCLEYANITYDPSDPDPVTGVRKPASTASTDPDFPLLNLFAGFHYIYRPDFVVNVGLLEQLLYHARTVICNGDERLFGYLVQWLAHLVQVPERKPGSALVLRSVDGAGKDIFFRIIEHMLGSANTATVGSDLWLHPRHNTYALKLLVVCNEVNFKRPYVQDRITSSTIPYVQKRLVDVEVPSCERWVFLTSSDRPFKVRPTDARYVYFDVSPRHVGDHEYFKRLADTFTEGSEALEHLYHYLMRVELADRSAVAHPYISA